MMIKKCPIFCIVEKKMRYIFIYKSAKFFRACSPYLCRKVVNMLNIYRSIYSAS